MWLIKSVFDKCSGIRLIFVGALILLELQVVVLTRSFEFFEMSVLMDHDDGCIFVERIEEPVLDGMEFGSQQSTRTWTF